MNALLPLTLLLSCVRLILFFSCASPKLSTKSVAIALLAVFLYCFPAHSKTIHLSCKTKDGQSSSTYYVDTDRETVKELEKDGRVRNLDVVLFTPSSINFNQKIVADAREFPGGGYLETVFKHQINRSTLAYIVEMNIRYDVAGEFKKTQFAGKCIIVKTPKAQF